MKFKIRQIGERQSDKKRVLRIFKIVVSAIVVSFLIFSVFTLFVLAQVKNIVDSRYSDAYREDLELESRDCGIFGCMDELIFNQNCSIKQTNQRANFLLLGAGGVEHLQGGESLTDTLIFASIDLSKNTVSMISIPRDLWTKPPGYNPVKINTLYGLSKRYYDDGFVIPKATIEDIFGLPIHYLVYLDFKAFKDVIDALGGIAIEVDNSFTDNQYPDGNFGYMTIKFERGPTLLDGETALQYVRSRHGSNGESSDFARSRRQHKIIQAIKDKVLSFGTLFKIDGLSSAIKDNYHSNLNSCEIYRFLMMAKDISKDNIYSLVLDDGPGGVLYTPMEEIRSSSYGGQYVLLPDGNNYSLLKKYVNKFLDNPLSFTTTGPKVAILNGTGIIGLANEVGAELTTEGINVVLRDNTYNRANYSKTLIYTEKPGVFYQTLLQIEQIVKGEITGKKTEPINYNADIVVILGSDYKND